MAGEHPTGTISVIINAEKSAGLPRNANLLPHFRHGVQDHPYEYIVFSGGSSFGLALVRMISRIVPDGSRRIFFENDLPAAESRIESMRTHT